MLKDLTKMIAAAFRCIGLLNKRFDIQSGILEKMSASFDIYRKLHKGRHQLVNDQLGLISEDLELIKGDVKHNSGELERVFVHTDELSERIDKLSYDLRFDANHCLSMRSKIRRSISDLDGDVVGVNDRISNLRDHSSKMLGRVVDKIKEIDGLIHTANQFNAGQREAVWEKIDKMEERPCSKKNPEIPGCLDCENTLYCATCQYDYKCDSWVCDICDFGKDCDSNRTKNCLK